MRINQLSNVDRTAAAARLAYRQARREADPAPELTADSEDSVDVSLTARILERANAEQPERAERLVALRTRIAGGEYHVPVDELVKRLLSATDEDGSD